MDTSIVVITVISIMIHSKRIPTQTLEKDSARST